MLILLMCDLEVRDAWTQVIADFDQFVSGLSFELIMSLFLVELNKCSPSVVSIARNGPEERCNQTTHFIFT